MWSGGKRSAKRQAAAEINRGGGGRFGSQKDGPPPALCLDSSDSEVEGPHDDAWYGSSDSSGSEGDEDWVPDFWLLATDNPDYKGQIQRELARQARFKKYKPGYDKERQQAHRDRIGAKKTGSAKEVVKMRRLNEYFTPAGGGVNGDVELGDSDSGSDADSEAEGDNQPALPFVSIQATVDAKLAAARKRGDVVETKILLAVRQHDTLRSPPHSRTELQAAREVAEVVWPAKTLMDKVVLVKGESRVWTNVRHYRRGAEKVRRVWKALAGGGDVPAEGRGLGSTASLIHDPDIRSRCLAVIHDKLPERFSAREFRREVTNDLRADATISATKSLGKDTASRWIAALGMDLVESKKGIYKDAHERPDVVAHRVQYVNSFETDILPFLAQCSGEEMEVRTPPLGLLGPVEREMVEVVQDECMFATNENRGRMYCAPGGDSAYHKSKGAAHMVSGSLCPCHGPMFVPAEDVSAFLAANADVDFKWSKKMYEADGRISCMTYIEPGKAETKDGHWDGALMVEQTVEVARIFEWLHPNKVGVFVFDNSTGHGVYPDDALKVTAEIGKGPGGVNAPGAPARTGVGKKKRTKARVPNMRDGWYDSDWMQTIEGGEDTLYYNMETGDTQCEHPHPLHVGGCSPDDDGVIGRVAQRMHDSDGVFKGMAIILEERGIDTSGLKARCTKADREHRHGATADRAGGLGHTGKGCVLGEACCCANLLSSQPDFLAQKCSLQELLEARGHKFRMLPKCHPECNCIEQFWASCKTDTRANCNYTMAGLRARVPIAIDNVSLATVRRYFRRQHRFCSLYRLEGGAERMPWKIREFVMKKYKGHRGVPPAILEEIDADLRKTELDLADRVRNRGIKTERLDSTRELLAELKQYAKRKQFVQELSGLTTFYPFDSDPSELCACPAWPHDDEL